METPPVQPQYPLVLLDDVRWHGTTVVGDRVRALLAVLANHPRDGISTDRLVGEIWEGAPPTNPTKALQVIVSRTRAATSQDMILRTTRGYRLGLDADNVDVFAHDNLVADARTRWESGNVNAARTAADTATRIGLSDNEPTQPALATLHRQATARRREAHRLLGLTLSAGGDHEAALGPLRAAAEREPDDEQLLTSLLRSEAATHGTGTALERYERYRTRLADRTGADPGPELRRVHAELLAADHPVREGVRFEATELLGRDDDLRQLRGLLRNARIVSIVGPGGLGKTRLANILGADAEQPVVRMVELVGITSPEDVVGELGSALGVSDSVTSRRALTQDQRADLRSRIAGQLGRTPTLLILDNCEHVVDAVAELAAFLLANTRDLRVVTTSRSPLNIAGERVYALGQLGTVDAVELFRQRALAARPTATLSEAAVTEVVQRLDGLPLAIELAAAKIRAMSVEDVAARLENRFTLLRGGDRGAADRHQTLLAVIDWSWNLLTEPDRTALRWLSVFHDGFTLPAAESMLGTAVLDALQNLTDQSLLIVHDTPDGVRYGMLETVREFGRMQLVDAGEEAAALAAQRRWARDYARRAGNVLFDPDQVAAMNLLRAEEANLADVLRRALSGSDPETVVIVLTALAGFWTVADEHQRLLVLTDAVDEAVAGWHPPAELADETRLALTAIVNTRFMLGKQQHQAWDLLAELGTESDRPDVVAMTMVTLAWDPERPEQQDRLLELCEHPNRLVAGLALLSCAQALENGGEPATAVTWLEQSLTWPTADIGPWLPAMLETQLAGMNSQLGRHDAAERHARNALPALERLDATHDVISTRSLLVAAALAENRRHDAERELADINTLLARSSFGADNIILSTINAELDIARGEHARALRHYRDATHKAGELRMQGAGEPVGTEPWTLYVRAAALCAHALYGTGNDGSDLFESLSHALVRVLDSGNHERAGARILDYPVAGVALFGLALWGLLRETLPVPTALRLAVFAAHFGYNRMLPSLAWENLAAPAERAAPGLLAEIDAEHGEQRGAQLLDTARRVLTSALAPAGNV